MTPNATLFNFSNQLNFATDENSNSSQARFTLRAMNRMMASVRIHSMSDLHLEGIHVVEIRPEALYLALSGDNGCAVDQGLLKLLEA